MTQVFNDNVQIEMTIDGDPWLLSEARVELSRISTPNYVKIEKMIPDPSETDILDKIGTTEFNLSSLLGTEFELKADNELVSIRDTNAKEDSLLFKGNLANISPTGGKTFEGIAYDPSQQALSTLGKSSSSGDNGGSILNRKVKNFMPTVLYEKQYNIGTGVTYSPRTIKASKMINIVAENIGLSGDEVNINMKEGGVTYGTDGGEYTMGIDYVLGINQPDPTIRDILETVRNITRSEWWFSKDGTFNFGAFPPPAKHELRYITDSSAGKTTPPYQSVKIIGSGIASSDGYPRLHMQPEEEIVVAKEITLDENGNPEIKDGTADPENLKDPVFTYRNKEISTDAQAKSVANRLIDDLKEQQASGTIQTVGFPEVEPLDVVKMPDTKKQPMGGEAYTVYTVIHKLNNSDGFKTEIEVGGLTEISKKVSAPWFDSYA